MPEGSIYQLIFVILCFVLWIVLMRFVLPRLGVST